MHRACRDASRSAIPQWNARLKSKTLLLPDGALIVKQNNMKADESPHALTIMSKRGGQWYWLEACPTARS